jgi:type VI secretion system protein
VREKSLFERLRSPEPQIDLNAQMDLQAVADSIQAHLIRMLNTRQEHALSAPDYGIPDLTELARGFPESAGVLEDAIRKSIEKYEPRLRDVSVRFAESEQDVLTISFEITARLVVQNEDVGVWFMTKIGSDGKVEVRG